MISYVLGLLGSLAVQTFVERFVPPLLGAELFATAAQTGREPVLNRYLEVERHSRLLYGCTLAFLLLAVGSLLVMQYLPPGQELVAVVCFVMGVAIAVSCPLLARHLQRQLKPYVVAFETHAQKAGEA